MAQVTSEIKGAVSLAELQASKEYLACTPKMQAWVTTLIQSNFDYKLATATAFDCKNLRQAHVFSYAVRKWPVIRAALQVYLGWSEQDAFLEDLKETIRRAPKGSVAQVRAQALFARMKFGVSTPDSDEPGAKSESPAAAVESKAPVCESRIPAGACRLYDKTSGALKGYRTADGQYIRLADVEVTR